MFRQHDHSTLLTREWTYQLKILKEEFQKVFFNDFNLANLMIIENSKGYIQIWLI